MFPSELFRRIIGNPRAGRGGNGGARQAPGPIAVGIFGKNKRSPEHLYDLGGSADLSAFKDALYDHGIRVAVDKNVWSGLADDNFISFNHVLVAVRGRCVAVARMAATRDALRRTDFPMIVAVTQSGAQLAGVPSLFEMVRATFHLAVRAKTLEEIHEIIAAQRQQAISAPPVLPDFPDDRTALGELAGRQQLGPDNMGLIKVLYQMQRQMAPWVAASSRKENREPTHMRLPPVAEWPVESATLWARFFAEQTAAHSPPILAFADANGQFVDILVGDPQPAMLRCLHASSRAMPDVTRIPYDLDRETIARATQTIAAAG
jgi:hypothetical protein